MVEGAKNHDTMETYGFLIADLNGSQWIDVQVTGHRVLYLGIATCSSNRVRTHEVFRVGSFGVSPRLFLTAKKNNHFKRL